MLKNQNLNVEEINALSDDELNVLAKKYFEDCGTPATNSVDADLIFRLAMENEVENESYNRIERFKLLSFASDLKDVFDIPPRNKTITSILLKIQAEHGVQ